MIKFQAWENGESIAPVRDSWKEAANDLVKQGFAVWTGVSEIQFNGSNDAKIERIEEELNDKE